jgi:hypothetical protein
MPPRPPSPGGICVTDGSDNLGMTSKQQPEFKASQLYDWHSEPKEERSSSLFEESTYAQAPVRRRSTRGLPNALGIAIIVVVMFGALGLIAMARML